MTPGATAWAAIGAALHRPRRHSHRHQRPVDPGHQADLAAQLAEVVMQEPQVVRRPPRIQEQACCGDLDQMAATRLEP